MALANDLRKGMAIKYNGETCIVLDMQHRTPGNLRAFIQCLLRNLRTGKSMDVRMSSSDKIDLVDMNRVKLEFSYKNHSGDWIFVNPDDSYAEVELPGRLLEGLTEYLTENQQVEVLYTNDVAAMVELPSSVTLTVTESADGVRGDSANNVMKPATLETGKIVQVPLFIKAGDKIRVSTETGKYMERA